MFVEGLVGADVAYHTARVMGNAVARIAEANKMPLVEFRRAIEADGVPFRRFREEVRREIVLALESMGLLVDAAHHEVAPGQHEIDLRYDDVLTAADNISTLRFTVKHVAIIWAVWHYRVPLHQLWINFPTWLLGVLATASLANRRWLLVLAWGFGAVGILMGLAGFFRLNVHPDWLVKILS